MSPEHSNTILEDLTHSANSKRIRAGVPAEVPVAHKIGSFSDITQSDCGIVYVPDRHYTLCIMLDTNGPDADKHIKEITRMTYDYVSKAK